MTETWGNLNHAMRDNYDQYGVDEYYKKVSSSYRNPFMPGIKKVIWAYMNQWWEAEGRAMHSAHSEDAEQKCSKFRVLDMAAGSGEATLCLLDWAARGEPETPVMPPPALIPSLPPIAQPTSQHSMPSRAFIPPNARRGTGTGRPGQKALFPAARPDLPPSFSLDIIATDPYTAPAYETRTGRECSMLSFAHLAAGQLPDGAEADETGLVWDMIICSFALHLVPSPSELWALLYELSAKARWLVVVAPHKKPEIKETWGWTRWDLAAWQAAGDKLYARSASADDEQGSELEIVREKVKLRVYRSTTTLDMEGA